MGGIRTPLCESTLPVIAWARSTGNRAQNFRPSGKSEQQLNWPAKQGRSRMPITAIWLSIEGNISYERY
jgi:hypothetical protein